MSRRHRTMPASTVPELIEAYWSQAELATNALILLNLLGALLLGLMVGYERSYHGRAAGMRTYGLVCMASCALTIVAGYPNHWFGGHGAAVGAGRPDARDPGRGDRHRLPRRRRDHALGLQHQRPDDGGVDLGLVGDRHHGRRRLLHGGDGPGVLLGDDHDLPEPGRRACCRRATRWPSRCASSPACARRKRRCARRRSSAATRSPAARSPSAATTAARNGASSRWRWPSQAGAPLSLLAAELSTFEGVDGFQLSHARN